MRVFPLETPVELPGVQNKEREHMAWLEGWMSGIFIGMILGAAGMWLLLSFIGRLK